MINPDDYELVNIKALENEVFAMWHKANPPTDPGSRYPSTDDSNDMMEIYRWWRLIRKHTYYRDK